MRASLPTIAFLAAALATAAPSRAPAAAHRIAGAVGFLQIHSTEADTMRAIGTFDVTLTPQTVADDPSDGAIGRMSIAKRFHGDLTGASVGEMLAAMTEVDGSAAYVAIERITGTLHGRSGTFVLQHSGTMARGAQRLSVRVVPDSGTDELVGLEGEMSIEIADGRHSYVFEYTLPAEP
jgi:hypothetical protein